jgi:redox-sensitive bicupin YhaK (pirin superfamily)
METMSFNISVLSILLQCEKLKLEKITKPLRRVQMITKHAYKDLGQHNYNWLKARYHFSFAEYYDPQRLGFGALRVINDDIISAGKGFGMHPHKDMEIITYVRKGAISHKDSMGNEGRTAAGSVQVMSAGSGIYHSEKNAESEDTKLYQIWIEPREMNVTPRWDSKDFPAAPVNDALALLVSGHEKDVQNGALYINQDAYIYGGVIQKDARITHKIHQQAYILLSKGAAEINGVLLEQGDGASLASAEDVTITAQQDTEILIIDVPKAQH